MNEKPTFSSHACCVFSLRWKCAIDDALVYFVKDCSEIMKSGPPGLR